MPDKAWKQFERRVAEFFGCRRNVLSGSGGRDDRGCSDTTHPHLFIEAKQRERHTVRTLYDSTKELARKERKIPVLCLADKGRPGFLVVVHSDDIQAFAYQHMRTALPAMAGGEDA